MEPADETICSLSDLALDRMFLWTVNDVWDSCDTQVFLPTFTLLVRFGCGKGCRCVFEVITVCQNCGSDFYNIFVCPAFAISCSGRILVRNSKSYQLYINHDFLIGSILFYFGQGEKEKSFYAVLFILPCFIWVLRTSIMGSLVAIMAFYFIKYRLKSLPIIVGIVILGVIAVFTIPSLRAKMFHDDNVTIEQFQNGDIQEDNINNNAREAMWKYLEAKFYTPHQIIGSGTGSVQNYMYNNYIFGGLTVPHSDFVQMKCDNGLIALILYACIAFLIFAHAFNTYWHAEYADLKLCAIVAGASIAGVFVTLYSDNAVNYSMATLSMPFGFYGMMLGLKHRDR